MAIAFACPECEHDLKVKEQLAGRRIRCPECGEVVAVPEGDTAITEGPSRRGDQVDRPRKKKKKKKSSKGLLVGLGVAAVLLAVGAVVLIVVVNQGDGDVNKQAKGDQKKIEPAFAADRFQPPPQPPPKQPATGIRRAAERTEVKNALRQLGLAFHTYCDTSRKGPQKWEDLAPYYERNAQITEMLTTKYLTFLYGIHLSQMPQGTSNTVLAYET